MNDLQHLQPAFRHYAMLSSEERASWIRQDRWIGYPRADQILKRLQELLSYPPRDRMPCLLLFGATGMGKTRIVQKFLRDNRSSFDEITGTTRVPVAAIQMPPTPWERDFYEELFDRTRHRLAGRHEFHSAAPSIPHRRPTVRGADADHRRDPLDAGWNLS